VIGRVAVLAAAGLSVDDFDHVLLPPLPASTVVQPLLAAAGIDPERVVTLDADTRFDTVELVAPTLPGIRRQYSPILSQWLRKVLDTAAVPPNRKLFVVRRGFGRNPVEETELEQIAAAAGFEIYDPMTSNDQLGDFQQAGAIIGVSGSALATVAVCAPQTRVLELCSDAHPYPYVYTTAAAGGLPYGYLLGSATEPAPQWRPSDAPFHVDLDEFRRAVDWAAGEASG
jgi:capsular polysaccharide biosynthesis protein